MGFLRVVQYIKYMKIEKLQLESVDFNNNPSEVYTIPKMHDICEISGEVHVSCAIHDQPVSELFNKLQNNYNIYFSVLVLTSFTYTKTSEYQYILVHLKLWEELAGWLLVRGGVLVGAAAPGHGGRLDHPPPHSSGPTDTQLHPQHRFGLPTQHLSMLLHSPALVFSVLLV